MEYLKIKNIRRLILLMLTYGLILPAVSQQVAHRQIDPSDPSFRAKYDTLNMGEKFVILVEKDEVNRYYIADFSKLSGKFEKVYFLNLVFKQGKVVNIDPDINKEKIWFLSNNKYPEKDIISLMNDFREQAVIANKSYTKEEKEVWMNQNDKYK